MLKDLKRKLVAPYTGAWIEMYAYKQFLGNISVAPYTEAWIEMFSCDNFQNFFSCIASYTGAWIEIALCTTINSKLLQGCSLCGSMNLNISAIVLKFSWR